MCVCVCVRVCVCVCEIENLEMVNFAKITIRYSYDSKVFSGTNFYFPKLGMFEINQLDISTCSFYSNMYIKLGKPH